MNNDNIDNIRDFRVQMSTSLRPLGKTTNERSDATRKRLIEAGLNLFGLHGYEATTTRALAETAEANLAAIPYHFGGKDGLYRAVAQTVLETLSEKMNGFIDATEKEIETGIRTPEQAIVLAESLLAEFCEMVVMAPEADRWIRFMMREQMEPTEVFDMIYDGPLVRLRHVLTKLLAVISGLETSHERLRVTAIQLVGMIYILRTAQTSVMREMDWDSVNQTTYGTVRPIVLENVRIVLRGLQSRQRG